MISPGAELLDRSFLQMKIADLPGAVPAPTPAAASEAEPAPTSATETPAAPAAAQGEGA